jgi:predicted 3-demethylubiquinone-9 3-methyltransferase (glyoxalase superfamily)
MTLPRGPREQTVIDLNDGPMFNFTLAISFFVRRETREEIDTYRAWLSEGGVRRCDWLTARRGVS